MTPPTPTTTEEDITNLKEEIARVRRDHQADFSVLDY